MTDVQDGTETHGLTVVRLLQNPLGAEAPAGERGDMVRVSDGRSRVYLLAGEYERTSPQALRHLLAQQRAGDGPA